MKRIFVDMDGTLARFHDEVNYLERMFEKGFFANLNPFQNLIDALQDLSKFSKDTEIYILSAYVEGEPPYCSKEKHKWCDKYLPFINQNHRLLIPIGADKSKYIPGNITSDDFLLDDYNVNLDQWQMAGGTAIKCKNNINHKGLHGELWNGLLIDNEKPVSNIFADLIRKMQTQNLYNLDEEMER